eukprot:1633659-Amphidinium_carterae.1
MAFCGKEAIVGYKFFACTNYRTPAACVCACARVRAHVRVLVLVACACACACVHACVRAIVSRLYFGCFEVGGQGKQLSS